MKQIVVAMLAFAFGMELVASALAVGLVSDGVTRAVGSGVTGVSFLGNDGGNDNPPEGDPPEGEPPDGYGGGTGTGGTGTGGTGTGGGGTGTGGGGTGTGDGDSEDSVVLTGAYPYVCETNTLVGLTLVSTTSDQNVILAQTNAYVTVSNCVLKKSGDMSKEDNSNFYAVNAVVAAKTASTVCISGSKLSAVATGANGLFASGAGSAIYAYDCEIASTNDSSRGLDATYEGTVIASQMTINTEGKHCAALATDRGDGFISVIGAKLTTKGEGSPLLYSTGTIEANGVTGTATGAQIAGIEGLSEIRIRNSVLSGSGLHASEPFANGVLIYQSMSGDSSEGTATFEVADSTFVSAITNGAMFFITNSKAVITVRDTDLCFDSSTNCLLKASGNDGENGWGNAWSNGAEVVFTAIGQTLKGNVSVDGISSLDMYLTNTTYTGTFIDDTTYTGNGDGVELFISADSTWIVTADCTLKCLTAAEGATIRDGNGEIVPIVNSENQTIVSGSSDLKITVSSYAEGNFATTNITDFTIKRTAFEAVYGTSASAEGGSGSGGSSGESGGTQTYYFKPHAPTNAVVWVEYNGTKLNPDMGHKYWLDAYWTDGVGVTLDISYKVNKGFLFADGSSETNFEFAVTENEMELYPPAGFETAYPAQAQSGVTYYLTLEEALAAVGDRSKIELTSAAQSNEQAVVDAAITNEAVVAALVSTDASAVVTLETTTPGLYYWIVGGTDVGAVTNAGTGVLSTDGGAVELSKPTLDATENRAFYRISAGVSASGVSGGD